ncbi:MAG: hypothetical protein D6715_04245 [Calditrichaeota bacterium]|nr:MAG: hypothetical protein D6715_04245 [Calditrichota bacterium]
MKKLCFLLMCFALIYGCQKEEQRLEKINPVAYSDVEFIGRRDTVITATVGGRIFVETNGNNQKRLLTKVNDEIYGLSFSRSRNYIFAATLRSGILVIDRSKGRVIKRLPIPKSWCLALDLSSDERILAAGSVDGMVYFWNINQNFKQSEIPTHTLPYTIKFYNNDQNLMVAGNGVLFWNLSQKKLIKTLGLSVMDADVNWQKKMMVGCSVNKMAYLLDLNHFSVIRRLKHPDFPLKVQDKLANIPIHLPITSCRMVKNRVVTAGADHSVRLWDSGTGKLLHTYTGHTATVSSIAVSPDQKQIASVSLKGELRFWDLE